MIALTFARMHEPISVERHLRMHFQRFHCIRAFPSAPRTLLEPSRSLPDIHATLVAQCGHDCNGDERALISEFVASVYCVDIHKHVSQMGSH